MAEVRTKHACLRKSLTLEACPQAGYELRFSSWDVPECVSPAQAVARAARGLVNVCMTYVPSLDPVVPGKRAHGVAGEAGKGLRGRPPGAVWNAVSRHSA